MNSDGQITQHGTRAIWQSCILLPPLCLVLSFDHVIQGSSHSSSEWRSGDLWKTSLLCFWFYISPAAVSRRLIESKTWNTVDLKWFDWHFHLVIYWLLILYVAAIVQQKAQTALCLELEELYLHAGWVTHKISDSWTSLYSTFSELPFLHDNQGRVAR